MIYYPSILYWDKGYERYLSTLEKLKFLKLQFELGINADFSFQGHGDRFKNAVIASGQGNAQFFSNMDLECMNSPYFSLALLRENSIVAFLYAHWKSATSHSPASVVVDMICTPDKYMLVLFEVLEKALLYFAIVESDGCECFQELRAQNVVEIAVDISVLPSELCARVLHFMGFDISDLGRFSMPVFLF